MNTLPIDSAIAIYNTMADRSEPKGARERLSLHLQKAYLDGERDTHRLTVAGVAYLQELDRKSDNRDKFNQ